MHIVSMDIHVHVPTERKKQVDDLDNRIVHLQVTHSELENDHKHTLTGIYVQFHNLAHFVQSSWDFFIFNSKFLLSGRSLEGFVSVG